MHLSNSPSAQTRQAFTQRESLSTDDIVFGATNAASYVPRFVMDTLCPEFADRAIVEETDKHEGKSEGKGASGDDGAGSFLFAPLSVPVVESGQVVCLLADLSGFTAVADTLSAQGGEGMDLLSRVLNVIFGAIAAVIEQHGGDILKVSRRRGARG